MCKLVGGILVMILCRSSPTFGQQEIPRAEEARPLLKDRQEVLRLIAERRALQVNLTMRKYHDGNTSVMLAIGKETYDLSSHDGIEKLHRSLLENAQAYCERISIQSSLTNEQKEKLLLAARVQTARNVRKLRAMTRQSANTVEPVVAVKLISQIIGETVQNDNDSLVKKMLAAITQDEEPN